MKRNIIWRTFYILLALMLVTSSLTFAMSKYVYSNEASTTTFAVYQLLPGIVDKTGNTSGTGTRDAAYRVTYYDCPAGRWAFFLSGGYGLGADNGEPANNSNGSIETRRKPGILCGIYNKASAGTFTIGKALRGARNNGSGGNGGNGKYILDIYSAPPTISSPPAAVANSGTITAKWNSLNGIVAVAGGGGGRGNSNDNNGGFAGGYQGQNGPFFIQNTSIAGGQSGIEDGWSAPDTHDHTTNRFNNGGGGGGGSQWQWWYGGDGTTNGSWFTGGTGSNSGGGGGGIFGGGGGSSRGGGGGSSYIDPNNCTKIYGNNGEVVFTGYKMVTASQKYPAPTTYYQYALNYFFDLVNTHANITYNPSSPEEIAILVWLGP